MNYRTLYATVALWVLPHWIRLYLPPLHLVQVQGHRKRRIPEVDQSVAIQLSYAEDGE